MGALAITAIEAVAARVLVVLGVGAVAGAAGEQARERQKEADKATTTPIARTDAQTNTTKEKCKKCPPDTGTPFNRPTAGWSKTAIAYQQRIAGLPVGPGFITEWMFNGVTFDGFDTSQCLLKEAKAKYDQFFDDAGDPQEWWNGDGALLAEASRQSGVAKPMPPVQLRWYFMQSKSYRFFSKALVVMRLPIETVFNP